MGCGSSHEITLRLSVKQKAKAPNASEKTESLDQAHSDEKLYLSNEAVLSMNSDISKPAAFSMESRDTLRKSSSKKYFQNLAIGIAQHDSLDPKSGPGSPNSSKEIILGSIPPTAPKKSSISPLAVNDTIQKVSAAVLIQRRIRGMEARAFAATRKITKQAEQFILKSLNPLLSPAENACNLLTDIISVT